MSFGPLSEWEEEENGEVFAVRFIEPSSALGFPGTTWRERITPPGTDLAIVDQKAPR